jgi:hypothetical protein
MNRITLYSAPSLLLRIVTPIRLGRALVTLVSLLLVAGLTVAAGMWALSGKEKATRRQSSTRPTSSISTTITPTGFEPAEMTRTEGVYVIAVYNRAGLKEVELRLDRDGQRISEMRVPHGKLEWKAVRDMTPGTYVLTEASNPAWSFKLKINSQ